MVIGHVGVVVDLGAVDGDLAQQPGLGEHVQAVVDGGERYRHAQFLGFLVELLGRQVAVALGEQQQAKRHALAGRPQPGILQLGTQGVDGAAGHDRVEVGRCAGPGHPLHRFPLFGHRRSSRVPRDWEVKRERKVDRVTNL